MRKRWLAVPAVLVALGAVASPTVVRHVQVARLAAKVDDPREDVWGARAAILSRDDVAARRYWPVALAAVVRDVAIREGAAIVVVDELTRRTRHEKLGVELYDATVLDANGVKQRRIALAWAIPELATVDTTGGLRALLARRAFEGGVERWVVVTGGTVGASAKLIAPLDEATFELLKPRLGR